MKSYIPYRLLIINREITDNQNYRLLEEYYRRAFDWANQMGQQGKRVFNLSIQVPDDENYNPKIRHSYLWCMIECTEEERKIWDEIQDLDVKHAIYTILKEDE